MFITGLFTFLINLSLTYEYFVISSLTSKIIIIFPVSQFYPIFPTQPEIVSYLWGGLHLKCIILTSFNSWEFGETILWYQSLIKSLTINIITSCLNSNYKTLLFFSKFDSYKQYALKLAYYIYSYISQITLCETVLSREWILSWRQSISFLMVAIIDWAVSEALEGALTLPELPLWPIN